MAEATQTTPAPAPKFYTVNAQERSPAAGAKPKTVEFTVQADDYKIAWQLARLVTRVGTASAKGKAIPAWADKGRTTRLVMDPGEFSVQDVTSQQERAKKSVAVGLTDLVTRAKAQGIAIQTHNPRPGLWPEGDAVSLSPSPEIERAVADSFTDDTPSHDIDTRAIVVVHKGRIVAERYADGFGPGTPQLGWSMSKSVTASLIGTLIAAGELKLDDPAPVPEWTVSGDPRHKITVRNLLNMSSGLAFKEPYDPGSDSTAMLFQSHDMAGYAATRPLAHPPGMFWSYSSGTANIASRIVLTKSGGTLRSLEDYAQTHLFGPLGMTSAVFEPDESGNFVGSSYLYASARDWARFGLFVLNDGTVAGRRLLPEGYVHFLCTPAPAATLHGYGGMFWLNGLDPKGGRWFPHLPTDYCAAEGHNDEFVSIFPSRHTVIVRLGWTGDAFRFDRDKHFGAILAALPR